jgi:hypothetical protein
MENVVIQAGSGLLPNDLLLNDLGVCIFIVLLNKLNTFAGKQPDFPGPAAPLINQIKRDLFLDARLFDEPVVEDKHLDTTHIGIVLIKMYNLSID